MKVVIQIPCYCEEEALPIAVAALPRTLPGVDSVEWLVIDDGSIDHTVQVAQQLGIHHIVAIGRHVGLAQAFERGVQASLQAGADILVNTDADNQYCADDIKKLIDPIIHNTADIVIGSRPIGKTVHFSQTKRILQRLGSSVVRKISGTKVQDAPSGFRAFSREAALSIRIFSYYSYTLETIIQAKRNKFRITSVPIRTNPNLRPSRLLSSTLSYIIRSTETIFRIFAIYYPLRFFTILSTIALLPAIVIGVHYLFMVCVLRDGMHFRFLSICMDCLFSSLILFSVGVIGDILSVNRRLLERIELVMRANNTAER